MDFKGEARSNKTHHSLSDPEARLYKKGEYTEAKLRFMTHALSENRNGLIVDVETTQANGHAEWDAGKTMIRRSVTSPGATIGGDKGYDNADFVGFIRQRNQKAHIARKLSGSAVDGRTARGTGYAMSLRRRKMIEEAFGWTKTVGGLRKLRHRGLGRIAGQVLFTFAAYNLVRIRNLLLARPPEALPA